jgi:serine phosphatase RsbU (regulator of sigma subunit)
LFGDERLDEAVRAPSGTAQELLARIVGAVQTFRAGEPATDDETCVVATVKPNPANSQHLRK